MLRMKKAVILLSGGLDSSTVLYVAKSKGYKLNCLIFDYGQRHRKEIDQAKIIAERAKAKYQVVKIDLPWGGSSLLDRSKKVPKNRSIEHKEIPSTYVSARNIIFLSFAASYAETLGAQAIFIGANAIDYSGYPDCRPEFFKSYQAALKKGMKQGVEGKAVKIITPIVSKTKAQIIKMGIKLKVPYHMTWSCYRGERRPCGECDSCVLRQKGFDAAGVADPAIKT